MSLLFAGYFLFAMCACALSARALGVSIVYALALLAVYPSDELGGLLTLGFGVAYFVAMLRE